MRNNEVAKPDVPAITLTNHAMLVAWGPFAWQMGLIEALEATPIPQRKRDHTSQTKLIEFLVAILGGCTYLQDISHGPHPLDQDQAVAEAWGQPGWADYSGVSRTLKACTEETVAAVSQVLQAVSQPFIDREVMLALRERGVIVYDGDLTSRPVSSTSTTYPDAQFGWMSDAVGLGYQAAMVSMHSPTYGRLWLSVKQHPGSVVSSTQAEALVRAAEACTGVRPRRRPGLLAGRIAQQTAQLRAAENKLAHYEAQINQAQQRLVEVERERARWEQRVAALSAEYQAKNKPERPHSRLAQARRKLEVRVQRCPRRERDVRQAEKRAERQRERVAELQAELEQLHQRHARLVEDNQINPSPIRAIIRLDAGFGSGPNVALLIEMGYEVYSKPTNYQVTTALRRRVTPETRWTRVGGNAEMVAWEQETITNCPYQLDVALERFYTGHKLRHSVLLHHGDVEVTADLPAWFAFYNGRQTIEAGIKEGKQVFQMHRLKVRSPAGLAIQEQFTAFAANASAELGRSLRPLGGTVAARNLSPGEGAVRPSTAQCQADGAHCGQHLGLGDLATSRLFGKVHRVEPFRGRRTPVAGQWVLPATAAALQKLCFFAIMNGLSAGCTKLTLGDHIPVRALYPVSPHAGFPALRVPSASAPLAKCNCRSLASYKLLRRHPLPRTAVISALACLPCAHCP